MTTQRPAIVLACHKLGLGVTRALGRRGVPVVGVYCNDNDMGIVSKYVVERYRCPDPELDEVGFLQSMKDVARRWAGGVVIPSDDAMLVAASKHKTELANDFRMAVADWKIVETFIDKKRTYVAAREVGVPCPKTIVPNSFADALDFVDQIGFPCLIKPSIGHRFYSIFKKKMLLVSELTQFSAAYEQANRGGVEMMVQEYIPGPDNHGINYNAMFCAGTPCVEFTARKVRLAPRRIGFPRVVISTRVPEVINLGRRITAALNGDGFSCTEFKQDARDGTYKLMELNGRQNLSGLLALKCGINFPYFVYRYVGYGEIPLQQNSFAEGVYWIDLEKDLAESIRSYADERYSLREYLKPYVNRHVFAVCSLRDLKPTLKRGADFLRKVLARVVLLRGWLPAN